MRILKRSISKDAGSIQVEAVEDEDLYCLYNLIALEDCITASTTRNVVKESSTGSTTKTKTRMRLKIRVKAIEFDAEKCSLRLKGRNLTESEHIKMHQYHTLTVETGQAIWIEKDNWDIIALECLEESTDKTKKAEFAAVVMQEGLCHVCLVSPSMTINRARIVRRMPKKKQGNHLYSKAKEKFFRDIYDAVKELDFSIIKCVLVGSPGFLKNDFLEFMLETATKRGDLHILKNRSQFLCAHATSGHKKAIEEMLADPSLTAQLNDVKAAKEVRVLQDFYKMLQNDEDRACYGYARVLAANDNLAIEQLLVSDRLFKAATVEERKKYIALVESTREHGGNAHVFSSMHVSGEQLDKYTGVAAILRFPLPELEEEITTSQPDSKEADNDSYWSDTESEENFSLIDGELDDEFSNIC